MPANKEREIEKVVKNKKCTGCSGCFNICPVGAISMKADECGFSVPKIDYSKCINCGLCDKVCPIINKPNKSTQYDIPEVYAGWNRDEKVRMKSSSGGIFSLLAEYFLNKGGYVCGASFDEKNKLRHIIISDKKDLKKLQGSKYVQSEIGTTFKEIRSLLQKDCWVLFSGTPCQTAGLKNFLKKDYEKLLLVDIVCHGAPSPLSLERYIDEIEQKNTQKVTKINFRDKSTGWKTYSFTLSSNKKNLLKENFNDNIYFQGFLENLYLRGIYTSCPYSVFPKYSDITLGDYWGIESYDKTLDDKKGVSVIILNNNKGKEYLTLVKKFLFLKRIDSINSEKKLLEISRPCECHVNRGSFFNDLSKTKEKFSLIVNKNLKTNNLIERKKVAILNMRFPTNNFGAILQSYALSNLIQSFGYTVRVINYVSKNLNEERDKLSFLEFDKFKENNILYTLPCYTDEDLINLNMDFDTFVVGSDQVWNYNYLKSAFSDDIGKYFLNFTLPSKKLISYAASFAEDHWNGTNSEVETVREALNRFDAISVREGSGVKICKELFNVKAEAVLDPTLLIDIDRYESIINSEYFKNRKVKYIAYFTLDDKLEKDLFHNKNLIKFARERKLILKNIRCESRMVFGKKKLISNSIPMWLNDIKNAELIVTDSYHCIIFSILFKKQFICVERRYAGNERLNHLFSTLEIENRFVKSLKEVNFETISNKKIDFKKAYINLEREKNKSINFLRKSLNKDKELEGVFRRMEEEFLNEKKLRKKSEAEVGQLQLQNRTIEDRIKELDSQNRYLQNDLITLGENTAKLQVALSSLVNSKTFRYANKIKNILFKFGIKKYRS